MGNLFVYLEARHRQAWRELGEPRPRTFIGSLRSIEFVFFGGAFRFWDDPGIRWRTRLVWLFFALALVAFAFAKTA